eukprot:UN00923
MKKLQEALDMDEDTRVEEMGIVKDKLDKSIADLDKKTQKFQP